MHRVLCRFVASRAFRRTSPHSLHQEIEAIRHRGSSVFHGAAVLQSAAPPSSSVVVSHDRASDTLFPPPAPQSPLRDAAKFLAGEVIARHNKTELGISKLGSEEGHSGGRITPLIPEWPYWVVASYTHSSTMQIFFHLFLTSRIMPKASTLARRDGGMTERSMRSSFLKLSKCDMGLRLSRLHSTARCSGLDTSKMLQGTK